MSSVADGSPVVREMMYPASVSAAANAARLHAARESVRNRTTLTATVTSIRTMYSHPMYGVSSNCSNASR
jgi:hypothetical protein